MLCPNCGRDNPLEATFCMACAAKLELPGNEARSHDVATSSDFVGRQREMGELVSALDDALGGKGRLVMLVGEPGIGKTRTAEELASYALQQDARVLWGRCHEQQGTPPFWPWVQIIRTYVRDCDSDQMRSEMGAGAGDIAELVPDVKERIPDVKSPPSLESPEQARFRLFDSITTWLKNASQTQPLVLILDNLHWADKPSLLLLEFLAQELGDSRLLIIGTYRDVDLTRQHPLTETLGELTRARLFQRIALRGLSLEDEGRYIQAASGTEPPKEFVEMLHSHTEGSPLFVGEVVRMLQQEGELTPEHIANLQRQDVRIPEGVREVIGRRLNGLSEDCNRVLTVASVIGREFEFGQLASLVENISEDTLLDVLDEALNVHVIEELPESAGNYQFSHALIQRTLRDGLSTTRRVRLHARIAETLERLYANDLEAHAGELAYHFGEAEMALGSEKLVRYSQMVGDQAISAYAYEDALEHFERALAAKGGVSVDAETAALLFGLGRAQTATFLGNNMHEAVATLGRAFDYYVDSGDVDQAVAIADHPIDLVHGLTGGTQLALIINRALDLVPPDSHQAGRILSRHIQVLGLNQGDYEGAQEAFRRALAIAQREKDTALEARIFNHAIDAAHKHLRWQEAVDLCLGAIEIARDVGDLVTERKAHGAVAWVLLQTGDRERGQQHAEACIAVAEKLRERYRLANALWPNLGRAHLEGDWRLARDLSNRALVLDPDHAGILGQRAILEYEIGDYAQGEPYLERLMEAMRSGTPVPLFVYIFTALAVPVITHVTGTDDYLDVAQTAAGTFLASPDATPLDARFTRVGLALIAVKRGDVEAASEQYAILKSQGIGIALCIAADRVLGLLAQTMDNLDDAQTHFEDALAFCRKAGYRPEHAWTCYDYAALRHAQGEREGALALLDEALSISTELGMRPLMEKVVTLKQQAESQPTPATAYPDGLTRREVEVMGLIAGGKSNREIGEELFISLNTVARHVSNIFTKTGSSNRAEAAVYAERNGLAS